MQLPLFYADVFSDQPFHGNPAAVCFLGFWLDDGALRKVAAENNLSATAFVLSKEASPNLRWFTPLREIRLCGHATLATAHVIFTVLDPGLEEVTFSTRFSGSITARKLGGQVVLEFPAFVPKRCAIPAQLAPALGLQKPPSEVLEANDTYIAVFDSQEMISAIRPDFALLKQLHPHAVIVTAPGNNSDFVSRYFAPSYGVAEDPVTGSAHCSLAPYWSRRLNKPRLHARQLSERGGELWCELAGERLVLEGTAVLTMRGSLTI